MNRDEAVTSSFARWTDRYLTVLELELNGHIYSRAKIKNGSLTLKTEINLLK